MMSREFTNMAIELCFLPEGADAVLSVGCLPRTWFSIFDVPPVCCRDYLLSIGRAFEIFPNRRYSRRHFEIFTFSDLIATKMITKLTILHGICNTCANQSDTH